ncbi:unnamed protein product, partial [Staurois parvus]
MYTYHQGTDDQCALMISVAPAVSPISAHQCNCQCPLVPHISAYQCTSMQHIRAYLSCFSVPLIN